jgi:hypothetical protein
MKYLCLAYYNPTEFAAMSPADMKALVSQCPPKDAQLKATGQLRLSASLGEPATTIRLQPRGGKTQKIDGPFSEAKELVGGLFIIEAVNADEAVKAASLHPAATLGERAGWYIDMHPIGFFEHYEGK